MEAVFRIIKNIFNLNGFTFQQNATNYAVAARCECLSICQRHERCWQSIMCRHPAVIAMPAEDRCHIRLAEHGSRFHKRFEHCWQIESRAADNLQHVGCGGLLL